MKGVVADLVIGAHGVNFLACRLEGHKRGLSTDRLIRYIFYLGYG